MRNTPLGPPAASTGKSAGATPLLLSWRPKYLRHRVLLTFLGLFCAVFSALEVLHQVSRKQNGLASAPESRRYLWTYGPTAVLIVIATFWSRVEYQAKQYAPWINLTREPSSARKTLLLDYVSVTQIQSFIAASRNGNYGVAIAIAVSVLLKLLVIFSSGLLSLGPVEIRDDSAPLILRDSFTTSDPLAGLQTTGTLPYNILTGILTNNLSYPEGTSIKSAFQWFSSSKYGEDALLSTTVDSFTASFDCEPAEVTIDWSIEKTYYPGIPDPDFDVPPSSSGFLNGTGTMKSSNCEMSSQFPWKPFLEAGNATEGDLVYWGYYNRDFCGGSTEASAGRLFLSVGEYRVGPETPKFDPSAAEMQTTKHDVTLQRSTNFICTPTYSVNRVVGTIDTRGTNTTSLIGDVATTSETDSSIIPGLKPWDFAIACLDTINPFQNGTSQDFAGADSFDDFPLYSNLSFNFDKALTLGVLLQGQPRPPIDTLFDEATLLHSALKLWQALGAQVAHKSLMTGPKEIPTLGTAITTQNRLIVRELSLRVMEALILVSAILAGVLTLLTPRHGIASRKLTTIESVVVVTASSPSLKTLLQSTGGDPSSTLRNRILGHSFEAHNLEHSGVLEITATGVSHEAPNDAERSVANKMPKSEYRPAALTWRVRIPVFAVLLALIAVLEAILQVSKKNDGLGDVTTKDDRHYAWTYIPTLAMVGVGAIFTTMDFSTRAMAPYFAMKSPAGVTYLQSIGVNFLDFTAVIAMIRSIRTRHWVVLTTITASVISAFLPIVVSGLYGVKAVPQPRAINLQETTRFGENVSEIGPLDGLFGLDGIATAGMVIHGNLTDPQWTYGDLVLPELSMPDSEDSKPTASSKRKTLTASIAATRSNFTCRIWKSSEFKANLTWGLQRYAEGTYENALQVIVPGEIYRPLPEIEDPIFESPPRLSTYTSLFTNVKANGFFGLGHAKHPLDNATSSKYSYMWGEIGSMQERIKHLSVATCNETLEQVDAFTTFFFPSFQLDRSHPPVPNEASRRSSNSYNPSLSYDFLPNVTSSVHSFDRFFAAVVYGKDGIPVSELGSAGAETKVLETITRMHKIVKTQQLSEVTRIPRNGTTTTAQVKATLTDPSRLRLVQDSASTRVLEAAIASMLILAVAASLLMPRGKLGLPKNPCSIAAVASYVADSGMLDAVAQDPEVLENSGWTYRMGWFEKDKDVLIKDENLDMPEPSNRRSVFAIEAFMPD